MRVLHFSKYFAKGGASRAALDSVIGQRDAGIDARLVVGRAGRAREDWLISPDVGGDFAALARFAAERLPARLAGIDKSDSRSIALWGVDGSALAKQVEADACVLHNIDGLLSIEAIGRFDRPVVWRVHDMWAMCGSEHYTNEVGPYASSPHGQGPDWFSRWAFRRKQAAFPSIPSLTICSPSQWLAREFANSALFHDRPIVVVPNGVDTELFHPQDRASARSALGLDPDRPLVVFGAASGTEDHRKGFDLLLKALADNRVSFLEAGTRFLAFGGGVIPDIGLPIRNMGVVGNRRQLQQIYSAASLMVVPSRMENLSLTVIEALSCGTPVVAFDIGGMPDMIEKDRTGWLVAPFDTDALGKRILDGAKIGESSVSIRNNCRRMAVERFNRNTEARQMINLFSDLC